MTNKKYITGALRTEAPVTAAMMERFRNANAFSWMTQAFEEAIEAGQTLDQVKKHLFYGKMVMPIDSGTIAPELEGRLTRQVVRLLHSTIGTFTEATESLEAIRKHLLEGEPLDLVNLCEEAGDQFWYRAIEADALGVSFEELMARNNRKLRTRYPEKFTEDEALTRDLEQERRALEALPIVATAQTITGSEVHITGFEHEHGYIFGYFPDSSELPCIWNQEDGQYINNTSVTNFNLKLSTIEKV